MSDLVTSVEIEDVLSSIRKLVSDEPRPVEKGPSAPRPVADRLVLTPDFRVMDPEPAESEEALLLHPDSAVVDGKPIDEGMDVQDELTSGTPFDNETMLPDEGAEAVWLDEDIPPVIDMSELAPIFKHVVPAQIVPGGAADAADGSGLETRIAQLESAVAQQDSTWDPDGLDDDENTPAAPQASVTDLWEAVDPEDIPAAAPSQPTILEAEEDLSDEEEAADDEMGFATEDDAMLDEKALREMVSELVRQELQGALGTRITRNVRKLVRREIHRVLDSKDFD